MNMNYAETYKKTSGANGQLTLTRVMSSMKTEEECCVTRNQSAAISSSASKVTSCLCHSLLMTSPLHTEDDPILASKVSMVSVSRNFMDQDSV